MSSEEECLGRHTSGVDFFIWTQWKSNGSQPLPISSSSWILEPCRTPSPRIQLQPSSNPFAFVYSLDSKLAHDGHWTTQRNALVARLTCHPRYLLVSTLLQLLAPAHATILHLYPPLTSSVCWLSAALPSADPTTFSPLWRAYNSHIRSIVDTKMTKWEDTNATLIAVPITLCSVAHWLKFVRLACSLSMPC